MEWIDDFHLATGNIFIKVCLAQQSCNYLLSEPWITGWKNCDVNVNLNVVECEYMKSYI